MWYIVLLQETVFNLAGIYLFEPYKLLSTATFISKYMIKANFTTSQLLYYECLNVLLIRLLLEKMKKMTLAK